MLTAFLVILLQPASVFTPQNVPVLSALGWIFWAVWLVIYPSMGVATWLVWRQRGAKDVSIPLVLMAVTFLQQQSFWLSNSVRMTTVVDATGLLLAYALAWACSRYSKAAAVWLVPLLVWMPLTFALKVWLWVVS